MRGRARDDRDRRRLLGALCAGRRRGRCAQRLGLGAGRGVGRQAQGRGADRDAGRRGAQRDGAGCAAQLAGAARQARAQGPGRAAAAGDRLCAGRLSRAPQGGGRLEPRRLAPGAEPGRQGLLPARWEGSGHGRHHAAGEARAYPRDDRPARCECVLRGAGGGGHGGDAERFRRITHRGRFRRLPARVGRADQRHLPGRSRVRMPAQRPGRDRPS
jgi:hypothetical protein